MTTEQIIRTSKFLSLVLRHRPELIGIDLDGEGWTDISRLLVQLRKHGQPLSRAELEDIVATNIKQRFAVHPDGERIRASQGHSVAVSLGLPPADPPEFLYHGTVAKFLESIRRHGLKRMQRQHVHLSADRDVAEQVGHRRGRPVILRVRSGMMQAAGYTFYRSQNGVWLTACVPESFIEFPPLPDGHV